MNKLNTQKFMSLFNEILSDRNGTGLSLVMEKSEKGDELDQLSQQRESQLNLRLSQRNLQFIKKIEAAKQRILDGTYGCCEECGNEINPKRLEARPTATMCISCQEEKERGDFQNINHRRDLTRQTSAKIISLEDHSVQKFGKVKDIKFESVVDM